VLRLLAAVGLVWDLHGVPDHIRGEARDGARDGEPETPALDVA
jgi:hypothetical protein